MVAIIIVAILIIKTKCGKFNRILLTLLFAGIFTVELLYGSYASVDEKYRLDFGPLFVVPMVLALTVPWLFMMLSQSLFKERASIPVWAAALLALQLLLDVFRYYRLDTDCAEYRICSGGSTELDLNTVVFTVIPSVIALVFNGLAVFWAVQDWRVDLVEQRRQFRRVFIILFGLLGIGIISLEDITSTFYPSIFPLVIDIDSSLLASVFIMFSLVLLCADPAKFVEQIVARQPPSPTLPGGKSFVGQSTNRNEGHNTSNANPALAQLLALLTEGCYCETGLNIARLADKMSIPEYRLRQLINKQLGFRNFNGFLNYYRVEDACQQLTDPAKANMTILAIALGVGFGSITSFNDAFKTQIQTTPSAYRKEKQG